MKERIELFLEEAKEKLNSADKSIEFGFLKSAAHDIYFAAENAARALLLKIEGNIPKDKNKIWIKITNLQRQGIITTFTSRYRQNLFIQNKGRLRRDRRTSRNHKRHHFICFWNS